MDALQAAQSRLNVLQQNLSAVVASIEQHENYERVLETKVKQLPDNTIPSQSAKAELINYQAALAGLRLQESRLKTKVEREEKLKTDADTSYQTLIRNNEDFDNKTYWHKKNALNAELNSAQAAVEQITQEIAAEELYRLKLVDKVFQLQRGLASCDELVS